VRYLGVEQYGVWITLTSILGWLTIFDLGIGNSAINSVAESLANNDFSSARMRINSTYLALSAVAAVLGTCIWISWNWISWPSVLGAKGATSGEEITRSAAIACFIFLANFPLGVTGRILGACKKITLANYFSAAANLLSLLLLVVATRLHTGLPGLILAFSGSTLVVGLLSTGWLFHHYEWLTPTLRGIRFEDINELLSTGIPFFAVQISGVILFSTDNVIIAQVLGARAVTPYSVTWKLFSYGSMLTTISLPTLWPAYADAFARRDFVWLRRTYWYNLRIAVGTTLIFVLILAIIARRFIAWWAGSAATPSMGLVLAMAAWTLLSAPLWCESCLLGASGRVKGQAIYSAVGAVVNIAVSIWAARSFGLTGVIVATICAYMFCIIIPLEVQRILSDK
jgi:O-antigen/teichoic acid export membrane protein